MIKKKEMSVSEVGIRICRNCGRTEIRYKDIHNHITRCFGEKYDAHKWGNMVRYL